MSEEVPVPRTPTIWRARPFCLRCGLCCRETEMVLTPSDVRRLELLGYRKEEFAAHDGRFYKLRNVEGRCFFYRDGRCTVYEFRPIGCSMYPIVIDLDTWSVTVERFCPLSGDTKPDELERAAKLARQIISELKLA